MDNAVRLLSSLVQREHSDGPVGMVSTNLAGDPDQAAIVTAVVTDYHQRSGRPEVTDEAVEALVDQQMTLTLVTTGAFGASSIWAIEATIKRAAADGLAILPKGRRTRGYRLDPAKVLDLERGFGGIEVLRRRVEQVRAAFPQVKPLTKERLGELPDDRTDQIAMAVFGTHRMPDGPAPGCLWLVESYEPADDIVDGVLIIRPEHGFSEHGSTYGKDLLRAGGEVVGFQPMTFGQALDLCDQDYEQALAAVRG